MALAISLAMSLGAFVAPVLAITCPDNGNLTGGSVSPASGTTATNFTFSVTYQDTAGETPDSIRVIFSDGTSRRLNLVSGNLTTGAVYNRVLSGFSNGTRSTIFRVTPGTQTGTPATCEVSGGSFTVGPAATPTPVPTPAPTPKPTPKPTPEADTQADAEADPGPTPRADPEADPEADRQADRQADAQADRQAAPGSRSSRRPRRRGQDAQAGRAARPRRSRPRVVRGRRSRRPRRRSRRVGAIDDRTPPGGDGGSSGSHRPISGRSPLAA